MIPVITYHAIGDIKSPLFTPVARFEAQLAALASAGYQTVSLADVASWLKGGPPPPENSVVLSFDDGYVSVYTEAWPRLKDRGFQATVFLISDRCGRDNQWPGQPDTIPTRPLLDWSQARELADSGWELAVHTRNHLPLTLLTPAQIEAEILTSQSAVLALTGQRARIFAPPYGASNQTVDDIVRQHFDAAVSTRLGQVKADSDPFSLPRIEAFYWNPRLIAHMKTRPFRTYLYVRQGLRHLRRKWRPDWESAEIDTTHVPDA